MLHAPGARERFRTSPEETNDQKFEREIRQRLSPDFLTFRLYS
eukprot:s74_g1.t1